MKKLFYAVALTAAGATSPVAAAELVQNGGFEAPVVTDPCCVTAPPATVDFWTATPDVNVVNGTFGGGGNQAYEGNQYLDLIGEAGMGSISQSFNTLLGSTYTLTFAFSHNVFSTSSASADIFINGSLVGSVSHNTGGPGNFDWQNFSTTFAGTGAATELRFVSTGGTQVGGLFMDAVSVTGAVPEPATWAMLILGFGMVGGALRRRTAHRGKGVARLAFS